MGHLTGVCIAWAGIALAAVPARGANSVIFVDQRSDGQDDGTSWADAFKDLQDALDAAWARLPETTEIWVAEGVYKPDRGTGDRMIAFDLPDGLELVGGFRGDEFDRCQRDVTARATILDGDLLDNDDVEFPVTSDCCVTNRLQPGCSDAECLAKVVQETGPNSRCPQTWRSDCAAVAQSYCCELCRPGRCDNAVSLISVQGAATGVVVDGFVLRSAETRHGYTGSAFFSRDSRVTVRNCTFTDNAGLGGAALDHRGDRAIAMESCTVARNKHLYAEYPGSIVFIRSLTNSTTSSITDSLFVDNRGTGVVFQAPSRIERSHFIRNSNTAVNCQNGCLVLDSYFEGNTNVNSVGAGIDAFATTVQVVNSIFVGNSTEGAGGAIDAFASSVAIANSVFAGNRQGGAGAVYAGNGAIVLNSVFVNNVSEAESVAGITSRGGYIANSIFRGNLDPDGVTRNAQIGVNSEPPRPTIQYCDVEGWTGPWNTGVIDVDPLFVDPDGADDIPGTEDDDYRLSPHSPLINAGDPTGAFLLPTDLDGHPRVLCGRVDMGAYEFGFGDYDCDRSISLTDLAEWPFCASSPGYDIYVRLACVAFDSDGDVDVDLRDFAAWQRLRRE